MTRRSEPRPSRSGGARTHLACWTSRPRNPVVSVVDLGIVRAVDAGAGDDHAHLYRLPRHPGDRARHPRRARRRRLSRRRDRDRARRRPGPPTGSARRARRSSRPMASRRRSRPGSARSNCPQCGSTRHRGDQPLRLDAVQGAMALPRLPRAVRPVQVPLNERRLPHPDDRRGRRRDRRGALDPLRRARGIARDLPLQARPASDAARPRSAARRCGAIIRSASRRRTTSCMVTVKRIAGGAFSNWANDNLKPGDGDRGDGAARQLHLGVRGRRGQSLCRLRRRLRDHAGHVAAQDGLADRAREPLHPVLRQSRQQFDHLPRGAGAA